LFDLAEDLFMIEFLSIFFDLILDVDLFEYFLFILELVHLQNEVVYHIVVVGEEVVQFRHGLFILESVDPAKFDDYLVPLLQAYGPVIVVVLFVVLGLEFFHPFNHLLVFHVLIFDLIFEFLLEHLQFLIQVFIFVGDLVEMVYHLFFLLESVIDFDFAVIGNALIEFGQES